MYFLRAVLVYIFACSAAFGQVGQIPDWPTAFVVASSGSPITTPILSHSGNATGPSVSAVNYTAAYSGLLTGNYSGVESRFTSMPIAGKMSNLNVVFPAGTGTTGAWTVTLRKNATSQTLTCTINAALTTNLTSCSDTSDQVTFAAGDYFIWRICPGTDNGTTCTVHTPTAATIIQISATFVSTNNGESFIAAPFAQPSNTVTNYIGFEVLPNATETVVSGVIPTAGTFDNLYVKTSAVPGGSATYIVTPYQNGVAAPSLTCTVASAATTCTSVGGSNTAITLAAGDTLSFQVAIGGTGTPTVTVFGISGRFQPTISGETIAFTGQGAQVPTNTNPQWTNLAGGGFTTGAAESNTNNLAPVNMTIKKLFVMESTAPGVGNSRALTLRANGASQALLCSVTNTSTVGSLANPGCSDTTHSYSSSTNDLLDIMSVPTGTNASMTWYKQSVVVTVP